MKGSLEKCHTDDDHRNIGAQLWPKVHVWLLALVVQSAQRSIDPHDSAVPLPVSVRGLLTRALPGALNRLL